MNTEHLVRRCPRLGGDVAFGYCKVCGEGETPCFKVFDCWWERFDVVDHMKTCLPAQVFDALSRHCAPPDKVTSLLDLIRQAQARAARE
jgi:hypothetical protein